MRSYYMLNKAKIEGRTKSIRVKILKLNRMLLQEQDNTILIYCYGINEI